MTFGGLIYIALQLIFIYTLFYDTTGMFEFWLGIIAIIISTSILVIYLVLVCFYYQGERPFKLALKYIAIILIIIIILVIAYPYISSYLYQRNLTNFSDALNLTIDQPVSDEFNETESKFKFKSSKDGNIILKFTSSDAPINKIIFSVNIYDQDKNLLIENSDSEIPISFNVEENKIYYILISKEMYFDYVITVDYQ